MLIERHSSNMYMVSAKAPYHYIFSLWHAHRGGFGHRCIDIAHCSNLLQLQKQGTSTVLQKIGEREKLQERIDQARREMEKTFSTTTIIKGSTSAASEVIAVDVDAEALCCPRCLHPLVPPVLQCAAGHLVCSPCHDNLAEMNRCASCFVKTGSTRYSIPTSYSRCHGVERILRSVLVTCPNNIHGCTAPKMLYHEKAEHHKICPSKAGSGGMAGRIVKMGPCGGCGGKAWEMDVSSIKRIVKLVIWHGAMADAMWVLYEVDSAQEQIELWGCPQAANRESEINLEPDEYLTCVKGHVDDCKGWSRFRSLTLVPFKESLLRA